MRDTVKERVEVVVPEQLKRQIDQQIRGGELGIEDRATLEEFSTRVVVTKLDDQKVEGVYYAGSTGTIEGKDKLEAAEEMDSIRKIVQRTGRVMSLAYSEAPPPGLNEEGEQRLKWKLQVVKTLI